MARSHRGDFLRKSIKKIQMIFLSEFNSLRTDAGFDFIFFPRLTSNVRRMNLKTLIVSAVAVTHNNLVDGALETKGGQTGSINLATSSLHTHTVAGFEDRNRQIFAVNPICLNLTSCVIKSRI